MFKRCLQLLKSRGCAVLFGIVLISACSVSAGAVGIKHSGDGLVLYSDMVLADFEPYMDPYRYPYALIGEFNGQLGAVLISAKPWINENDYICIAPGATILFFMYSSESLSWSYFTSQTAANNSSLPIAFLDFSMSLWTNSNIYQGDSLIFPASEPFPLTGYDYYEWVYSSDNSTSSLGLFFTSDLFSYDTLSRSYMVYDDFIGVPLFSSYDPILESDFYYASSNGLLRYVFSDSDPSILPGLYLDDTYRNRFKFFICPTSTDPFIDFSLTSLTVSNPEYDYQSAEFDVSWSNLPEISYPNDIQYFLRGRLSDGAASHPPEIYLGSSDDPPEAMPSVYFSFTDLQPETQYSAIFELVYNDTGNFRDFISSGVSSTVSFTTLSDGSISEGDKAIINAIQQGNKDNQQWTDSQFGSAVGDLPEDTAATDSMMEDLDQKEEAYMDDAYSRFQELSSSFSGFDGTVGSGIGLAGTLFSRFFNALGSYKIIYTFPLLLGLAMVIIGRLGRSMFRTERESDD